MAVITIFDEMVQEFKGTHNGRHPITDMPPVRTNPKQQQKAVRKAKRRSAAILRQGRAEAVAASE